LISLRSPIACDEEVEWTSYSLSGDSSLVAQLLTLPVYSGMENAQNTNGSSETQKTKQYQLYGKSNNNREVSEHSALVHVQAQ